MCLKIHQEKHKFRRILKNRMAPPLEGRPFLNTEKCENPYKDQNRQQVFNKH